MSRINILNPWDVQSKHVMGVDGISKALYAGDCRWGGGEAYVCYAIEGNIEQNAVCYTVDCRNLALNKEKSGTLQAKNVVGFSYNYLNPVLKENK